MLDSWRARRRDKAAAAASRAHRRRVIAVVQDAVATADPTRVGPAAAGMLAASIAGPPGRALVTSLHGTAPSALAELGAGLAPPTSMDADAAEQLYIAVDRGWDGPAGPSHLLEAIENWVEYLKAPDADAAASVLWLSVLAHEDEAAALQQVRRLLTPS